MKPLLLLLLSCCCAQLASGPSTRLPQDPPEPPRPPVPTLVRGLDRDPACTAWVDSVLSTLDLRGRIGQLMVYTIAPKVDQPTRDLLRRVVTQNRIGGLLFSGGRLEGQAALTQEAQDMAQVPLMITQDGEWGLAMRLKDTPLFPRNRVLGCITRTDLLYEYGLEVARECRELGIAVNFAPVADVDINPANPVINTRSWGDDPRRVAKQVVAYAGGLERGGVLSVSKHFPGHGDTDTDSHLALPLLPFSRERLDTIELIPFQAAINAGLGGIMVGHLEVPALEPEKGRPSSLSAQVVDGLLHTELGFQGLTFTDALAMKGVAAADSPALEALRAGNDVLLVPQGIDREITAIATAVEQGRLPADLIEEKCRKVLLYKYALGLSTKPSIDRNGLTERISTPQALNLVQRLKNAAVTVLKNDDMLPIVSADKADEASKASQADQAGLAGQGGQAGQADDYPPVDANTSASARNAAAATARAKAKAQRQPALLTIGTATDLKELSDALAPDLPHAAYTLNAQTTAEARKQLRNKLKKHDRILVCVATKSLDGVRAFLEELKADELAYIFFIGSRDVKPLVQAVKQAKAVVLAHSAEAEVQHHVARILLGQATADGRLSVAIPGLFPTGTGITLEAPTDSRFGTSPDTQPGMLSGMLSDAQFDTRPDAQIGAKTGALPDAQQVLAQVHGIDLRRLDRIDSIAIEGIQSGAYPGCQVVVMKDGQEIYSKAFGTQTWPEKQNAQGTQASKTADPAQPPQPTPLTRPVRPTDVYDLASLTKVTSTLLAVMRLYDEGRIKLTDRASTYLPYLRGTDKERISLRELLLHESGLPASILFYELAIEKDSYTGPLFRGARDAQHPVRVGSKTWANPRFRFIDGLTSAVGQGDYTLQVSDSLWLHRSFRDSCRKKIADTPLRDKRYRYSDVGFILLQQVVEAVTDQSLSTYVERTFYQPMGLTHTGYQPLQRLPRENIVPSASDRFLRKTSLRGYVHDEAAAFQGGVSGNAGLFSNAHEVAMLCQMVLNGGEWNGHRYLSEQTIRTFTTTLSTRSRRALGYDKPDRQNPAKSPCAASAPASVYGHTGFTGTCAWIDPDHNLVYVFLSNRIWPDVWNGRLMSLDIRPRIQEAIYAALTDD